MKAYLIPGWLEGVKIRRECWANKNGYIIFTSGRWQSEDGKSLHATTIHSLFDFDDWEPYVEAPVKKKRVVKLYRPIMKDSQGYYIKDGWHGKKSHFGEYPHEEIVGWEEREITIEE